MHEYAVTKNIVELVSKKAAETGIDRVNVINLVVGELSSIIDDSVQMYFDILSQNTPAHNAKLVFERVNPRLKCNSCGMEFEKNKSFSCPACSGDCHLIKGTGNEFYIKSIET